MPIFTRTSMEDALEKTRAVTRKKVLEDYLGFIDRLTVGRAVKAVPSEDESMATVRRRVGDAARMSGKDVEIKRADDGVYFWLKKRARNGRRRSSLQKRN